MKIKNRTHKMSLGLTQTIPDGTFQTMAHGMRLTVSFSRRKSNQNVRVPRDLRFGNMKPVRKER